MSDDSDIVCSLITSDTCIVGFASMGEDCGGGIPPFEWAKTFHDLGVATVLMRDRKLVWFQEGVYGVGDVDSVAQFVWTLGRKYKRVITVGISMGGYAAILFGMLGFSNEIIAMSPQTRLSDDPRWDGHWNAYVRPVMKYPNLRALFAQDHPNLHIFVGDQEPDYSLDMIHANNVRYATLTVMSDNTHSSVGKSLRDMGYFQRLILREAA